MFHAMLTKPRHAPLNPYKTNPAQTLLIQFIKAWYVIIHKILAYVSQTIFSLKFFPRQTFCEKFFFPTCALQVLLYYINVLMYQLCEDYSLYRPLSSAFQNLFL